MTDETREATMYSIKQHIRSKEMWTGSQKKIVKSVYTIIKEDNTLKFQLEKLEFVIAIYKLFDEIITNAVDHQTNFPGKVTYIKISYDEESGTLQVINNGPGIPVYQVGIVKDAAGNPVVTHYKDQFIQSLDVKWYPQFISEEPLTGNNLNKREYHFTGGTNGIGMKIANYLSEFFILETIDGIRGKKYLQVMTEGSDKISPPTIKDVPKNTETFTSITFKPAFNRFMKATLEDYILYGKLIKTRAYQLSSFCGIDVYYNNELISAKNLKDIGSMFAPNILNLNLDDATTSFDSPDTDSLVNMDDIIKKKAQKMTNVYHCQLKNEKVVDQKGTPLIWNICVGPSRGTKFAHMSIVNGMYIIDGGNHIDWLANQVVEHFAYELKKENELSDKDISRIQDSIYIVMSGKINFAKASIESQTKEKVNIQKDELAGYKFSDKQLKEMWKICEAIVTLNIINQNKKKKKTKKPIISKYKPARNTRDKKKSHDCSLFIPEGDSAANLIDAALTDKTLPQYTFDNYGYYSIQGVPINARRAAKTIINPINGEKTIIYSEAIHNNDRLEGLYYILGLDETKKYDLTPEGDKEYKTLKYGAVILATDQDEDGKGQITSLIINYFIFFWPALIKRGFVKRLNTPIIRTISKKNIVKSFNSITGWEKWKAELKISDSEYEKAYETRYYKGLAKHDEADIRDIFMKFNRNLITFSLDSKSEILFDEYFSKNADHRKNHLRAPVDREFEENATVIPLSDHLEIDTKSFKRYVIIRMLPHIYDGLLLGRRKVFAYRNFMNKNQEINVSSLAGLVKAELNYHHGDAAITETITKMGQEFFPRIIPLLLGNSICKGFGSRKFGGSNMAEARYISIKQNAKATDLIFPREDDYLLPHNFEEGKRCEPKFYIPIIPMVLLESQRHPAQGWDVSIQARDYKSVFENVKFAICSYGLEDIKLIKNGICSQLEYSLKQTYLDIYKEPPVMVSTNSTDLEVPLKYMPVDTNGWRGIVRKVEIDLHDGIKISKYYSVGSYIYDKNTNTITITELPHGICSDKFTFGNRESIERQKAEYKKELKKDKKNKTSAPPKKSLIENFAEMINEEEKKASLESFIHGKEHEISEEHENKAFRSKAVIDKEYVEYAYDESTDKQIEIIINLKPGAWEKIKEYSNSEFDGVIEYFKLRTVIYDSLNLIDEKGFIKEFNTYDEIFRYWFNARRLLYEKRFIRNLIIIELQIYKLELIQRFASETKTNKINISRQTRTVQEKILEEHNYPKISSSIINNPGFIPIDKIQFEALENPVNLSYSYILELTQSQLSEDSYMDRDAIIDKLRRKLSDLTSTQHHFPGATEWLDELDQLRIVIDRGLSEGWGYDLRKKQYN